MLRFKYTSFFKDDINAFIDFKAKTGKQCTTRNWVLFEFDQYCADGGRTTFDKDTVLGWYMNYRAKNPSGSTSWASYIRDFGRYLKFTKGEDVYVLEEEYKNTYIPPAPYLLSEEEITAFFDEAKHYKTRSPWEWQVVSFFGLMYALGLRTCEVKNLAFKDVDFKNASIDILGSKAHRSRRLPLTDELVHLLYECDLRTSDAFGRDRNSFFMNSYKNPFSEGQIVIVFRRIWRLAGLPEEKGGKKPRPYDFRHHFAYANIERWQKKGINVESMIPYLAKFMGHASYNSTLYYTHISPGFLKEYSTSPFTRDDLLPEVGFDG
ncbi:MAG: tyrosine-type recombinase/integrase [Eggerthellaceae bacterium]|nr:tyrosine-type recombinase/integrase [Eggerthellaceae bacterium]